MEVTVVGLRQSTHRNSVDRREMLKKSMSGFWLTEAVADGHEAGWLLPQQSSHREEEATVRGAAASQSGNTARKYLQIETTWRVTNLPGLPRIVQVFMLKVIHPDYPSVPGWPGQLVTLLKVTWSHAIYKHMVVRKWKTNLGVGKGLPDQCCYLVFEKHIYYICFIKCQWMKTYSWFSNSWFQSHVWKQSYKIMKTKTTTKNASYKSAL